MSRQPDIAIPTRAGDPLEVDYSAPEGDDFDALAHDRVPVRSMEEGDLDAVVSIDRKVSVSGRDRQAYLSAKMKEVLGESGVRVSLVAELDGIAAGFIMARVDFGEFGRAKPVAVLDTLGVNPDFQRRGVGQALMSQLMANLKTLRVDRVCTELAWSDAELLSYLGSTGFTPAQRIVLRRAVRAD